LLVPLSLPWEQLILVLVNSIKLKVKLWHDYNINALLKLAGIAHNRLTSVISLE
jgi:hypothetical protein